MSRPHPFRRAASAFALLLTFAVPVSAQGVAGAFLAARHAGIVNDFPVASEYLEQVLVSEPDNAGSLEALTLSLFSAGERAMAATYANRLMALSPENRMASLVLLAQGFGEENYEAAAAIAETETGIHPLVVGLAQAWALMGRGQVTQALALFEELAEQPDLRAFALYCKSLALALVGDVEGAVAILEDPEDGVAGSLNRRGYLAFAQLLGLTERYEDGRALIAQVFAGSEDPEVAALDAAFAAEQAVPFSVISTPAQGMAEVFSVMSNAMQSASNSHEALLYAQAALWANPAHVDTMVLLGQIYESLARPEMAAEAYAQVPQGSVFAMAAQMGRAQVLETQGDLAGAIEVLENVTQAYPTSFVAEQVLGDFLRRASDHQGAIDAYTRAFALHEAVGLPANWTGYFARAVAYERTGQWPEAEADFRTALELEPNQPSVLNYLGYSLVERGENLDEALDMIEQAVAGEPDSGFIVDSLGWALFRLGRYHIALPHLERAVSLNPSEPELNDHLGDVYWAVGRYREARFQWRRALSFGPSEDLDVDRLRRKLEIGLEAVRAEEGLPPLNEVD